MQYVGRVIQKRIGTGSKSERLAVLLSTPEGEFVLRREGGNAFQDPVLEGYVGKTVQCEGTLHGYTLIVSSIEEKAEP
jgi:hypothetical protein